MHVPYFRKLLIKQCLFYHFSLFAIKVIKETEQRNRIWLPGFNIGNLFLYWLMRFIAEKEHHDKAFLKILP